MLWGFGLSKTVNGNDALLHDGRALSVTEAILWHSGEAERSKEAFRTLPKSERDTLLRFLAKHRRPPGFAGEAVEV